MLGTIIKIKLEREKEKMRHKEKERERVGHMQGMGSPTC
jgi:hypothetical protein